MGIFYMMRKTPTTERRDDTRQDTQTHAHFPGVRASSCSAALDTTVTFFNAAGLLITFDSAADKEFGQCAIRQLSSYLDVSFFFRMKANRHVSFHFHISTENM